MKRNQRNKKKRPKKKNIRWYKLYNKRDPKWFKLYKEQEGY